MTFIDKITRGVRPIASTVQLWLIFLACAAVTTLLLAASAESALSRPPEPVARAVSLAPDRTAMLHVADHPRMPRVEFEPTFVAAKLTVTYGDTPPRACRRTSDSL